MRQTGRPVIFQTHGMEVWHQKSYSGFYGAHAKVFESPDYYMKSKPASVQWIFSPTPGSLKLVPKEL